MDEQDTPPGPDRHAESDQMPEEAPEQVHREESGERDADTGVAQDAGREEGERGSQPPATGNPTDA